MQVIEHNRIINNGNRSLTYLFLLALILNPFSHFLEHVIGIGNTFWYSYIIWILLLFIGHFLKSSISLVGVIALVLMIISSCLPIVFADPFNSISEVHMSIMIWVAYYFSMCIRFTHLSHSNIKTIYRTIAFIGFISCLYAMVVQSSLFFALIRGIDTQLNSWFYVSFYRQRNIFGEYCFLSSVASLYMFYIGRKKIYIVFLTLNILQVLLIESRAALLGIIILIVVPFFLKTKHKILFIISFCIIAIIGFIMIGGADGFIESFSHVSHEAGEEEDSSVIRVLMWQSCINFLNNNMGWFWGFGTGSIGKFLYPLYGVGSTHSAYFDSLFDGGIFYLFAISMPLFYSLKSIMNHTDQLYKIIHVGAWIAYILYNFMEAGMAPFASNFFSITATLLFVTIPLNYYGITLGRREYIPLLIRLAIFKNYRILHK